MYLFKLKPERDKKYLDKVRGLPCCMCSAPAPSEAHHIIRVGEGRTGGKASDYFTMPMCRNCHTLLHESGIGVEKQWEAVARTLAKFFVEC